MRSGLAVTVPEEEQHGYHHSHPGTQAEQHTQQVRQVRAKRPL